MKQAIIAILLLLAVPSMAQDDYYEEGKLSKKERKAKERAAESDHCYCPYQQSTTVWQDIWNVGIVGTSKGVYQSTVKPQVIGDIVGAAQGAANDAPVPALVGSAAVTLGISQANKARRHSRNKQVPEAGRSCNCHPCAYHGQRYGK